MAGPGEATIMVKVDARRVLDVVRALDMMARLLDGYGHILTGSERAVIEKAVAACEQRNLNAGST